MTVKQLTGASPTERHQSWQELPWSKINAHVFRLQMRIAKAEREGRTGKVKALQRLLTSSFYGKCLSVKRVTSNVGAKTAGVDGITWRTPQSKMQAVNSLSRKAYKPLPLRRIYIPKKSGKLRPLSIPVMKCRAMQALWHAALVPIAEERADKNAYGFRPKRSAHDAIEQCFCALSHKHAATWVLEGDIKACFDRIDHNWLLENITMDKVILRKFLKSGYVDEGATHLTELGTPQGGIISPTLAVMALSGLESTLINTGETQRTRQKKKINMISYADDFIVTASSEQLLRDEVIPSLETALKKVGLELSREKTKITQIQTGFDFLGFNIRKYPNGKLQIKPSKASISAFIKDIKNCITKCAVLPTEQLIHLLNQKIIGWTNYYRSVVSSKVFSAIDHEIFMALKLCMYRKHPNKGRWWIMRKYFTTVGGDQWRFYCTVKDKSGNKKPLYLKQASETLIRRHKKIKADATPFDPRFKDYFEQRFKEQNNRYIRANSSKSAGLRIIQPYASLSGVR
ncbi:MULTISPECIES: group II intron reverse transcriptase/maturase [Legionella]|uniref:Reverse transcriptase n=1 Tax=Legionella rubrilucens TaxID=458 RepID=A0A0W0XVQ1_9GAMM|nr:MULTISPECIES: group II intron reverse transcriptase/maturase [Legionella]KTD48414.1 reverse transcriptase [Legionella rubrilucens]MDX1837611.1 group II intron reverse transcriptase/maturase [Legionella taurinensis]